MEVKAKLENVSQNLITNKVTMTFSTDSKTAAEEVEKLQDKELRLKVVQYRKKRSLSANALFWACCGRIAEATYSDKWTVYLNLLRNYGKFTYVCVQPHMVEAVKNQWREAEVWNSVDINGKPAVQMICYFGSSSYDTKEMSRLIDGTLQEMKELGLDLPMPQDIKTALEQWEVQNGQRITER